MPIVKVVNQLPDDIFVTYYYSAGQTTIQKINGSESQQLSNPVLIDSRIIVNAWHSEYGIKYCANDTKLTVSEGGPAGVLLKW